MFYNIKNIKALGFCEFMNKGHEIIILTNELANFKVTENINTGMLLKSENKICRYIYIYIYIYIYYIIYIYIILINSYILS